MVHETLELDPTKLFDTFDPNHPILQTKNSSDKVLYVNGYSSTATLLP